ncbi:DNA ligase D [Caldibacillus thermoamylovorans]|jgi:bifunctional non-homologous end joining protein LigD|nr:DNA ligase D [Caldibacillus thermoamylovorans]
MKPMLPTLSFDVPKEEKWVYEIKYDGFRAIIQMDDQGIDMISRNGKSLIDQFPEAVNFFNHYKKQLSDFFPILLDGELTILENDSKSDFFRLQTRGRMRSKKRIFEASLSNTSTYLAFDLLQLKGQWVTKQPFLKRKELLYQVMKHCSLPLSPDPANHCFIQFLPFHKEFHEVWETVKQKEGEGIVAKQAESKWIEGKRTTQWLKIKNWKKVHCFITAFEKNNGFFHVAVYEKEKIIPIGLFKNGMNQDETNILIQIMKKNATDEDAQFVYVLPSICVELFYLQFYDGTLREPFFSQFLFQTSPADCTLSKMMEMSEVNKTETDTDIPINITHPEKPLWEKNSITKLDYIKYLKFIFPYMEPFLRNRLLTVIRYPHGIFGEAFFQKNCPDYAPDFVETYLDEGINYILCNNFETFLWLGNQLAIEFHTPFRTIDKKFPTEVVIDLDPPTKAEFPLAIEAALYLKEDIIDKLGLHAFVKVSGNRGIQVYFPLSGNRITWNQTRKFTEFIANYLLMKNDKHFTIERLKKNRGHRLYVDYIQHAKGKTIICPFSVRGNANAGVAAPLEWDELTDNITPDGFSIDVVMKRIEGKGNPFASFFQVDNDGPLQEMIRFIKDK